MAAMSDAKPFVAIIMPALEEERFIAEAIASIVPQTDGLDYELLVVDGGSTDRTRSIVEGLAASDPRIRVIVNDKKIQSAGVNIGARLADPRARFMVRADCHVRYPEGFVARCVARLATGEAASVVVPMRTEGETCLQKAIAAAQNSRLGNGGAAHRLPRRSGFVEHGHHAAFDRDTFLELGGYDESFTHNEDAEFDRRLLAAGKRIYLDVDATVTYYPRSDLPSLARQYFRHGRGRANTILKHRAVPRLRQVLPVVVLVCLLLSLALAVLDPIWLGFAALYVAVCIGWGGILALQGSDPCLALSGIAAIVMHLSWGAGFLARLVQRPPGAVAGPSAEATPG